MVDRSTFLLVEILFNQVGFTVHLTFRTKTLCILLRNCLLGKLPLGRSCGFRMRLRRGNDERWELCPLRRSAFRSKVDDDVVAENYKKLSVRILKAPIDVRVNGYE